MSHAVTTHGVAYVPEPGESERSGRGPAAAGLAGAPPAGGLSGALWPGAPGGAGLRRQRRPADTRRNSLLRTQPDRSEADVSWR